MNNEAKKRRTYPTSEQKAELRRLVDADVELRSGKFSASFTKQIAQLRWAAVARQVNSIYGAKKTWFAWRKTWQDMRSKAKKRQAEVRRIRILNGRGFGASPDPLSGNDATLRDICESSGHNDSQESARECKNIELILAPESTATRVEKSFPTANFPKQEITSPVESEEEDSGEPPMPENIETNEKKRNPTAVRKTNLTKTFLTALALNKEKNEFKKQFYNSYLVEMRRQTDALMQIANNIAKISETSGDNDIE